MSISCFTQIVYCPGFLADNPAVAFTAVVSPPSLNLLGAGETIIFDSVITNVGNAYKNTSGMFRAPLQGVYVFNFALMMDPGLDEYIELVKDGNHVMWNYGHAPGSTHYISASRTATLELQASNQMYFENTDSQESQKGFVAQCVKMYLSIICPHGMCCLCYWYVNGAVFWLFIERELLFILYIYIAFTRRVTMCGSAQ